jgi:putative aminopeptidase FrvX
MSELLPFLKNLITAPGLSGYESPVRDLIKEAWRPLTDEFHISRLGSLHALRRGSAAAPRLSLLLEAHMDAIGLMVSGLVEGFLCISEIGGVDPRVLPSQPVIVHAREELPGVLVRPPAYLLPEDAEDVLFSLQYLLVDVGLPPNEVDRLVRVGDLVSFAQPPLELGDDYLAGHSLDNRASIAALTVCLQELQTRRTAWDVWAVASTQEEVSMGGALTSAFELRPALAVAVDVTFGRGPGSPDYLTFPLGSGPTLSWGPNIHPELYKAFEALADRLEIPYKPEPIARHSGTDAMVLQTAADGIPTMLLEIPIRYMHTPVEMVSLKDIRRTGRLLAEFAASLTEDFLERLAWDD